MTQEAYSLNEIFTTVRELRRDFAGTILVKKVKNLPKSYEKLGITSILPKDSLVMCWNFFDIDVISNPLDHEQKLTNYVFVNKDLKQWDIVEILSPDKWLDYERSEYVCSR